MAFIGRKPTPSALTSSDISADIIDATKIADDAISEEHLDPTIITGLTALGAEPADTDELIISDAGTLKRMDYSHIKGGGGLIHILTTNITSGTASVEFKHGTNGVVLDSTYNAYLFVISDAHPADDGQPLEMTVSNNTGTSYLSSNYDYGHKGNTHGGTEMSHYNDGDSCFDLNSNNVGNAADESISVQLYLHKPSGTDGHKLISGTSTVIGSDNVVTGQVFGGCNSTNTSAIDAVKFNFGSGDIDRGNFSMFGLANS